MTSPHAHTDLRPSGGPPYFHVGQQIQWRYHRPGFADRLVVRPMTVVRDDADGLVAWLAPGTPVTRPVLPDGRGIREAPLLEREIGRAIKLDVWHGTGILKVAPTGVPWSVWVFWDEDWNHLFWYANLEDVHVRDNAGILTQDHTLDVVIRPDSTTEWKDEDELEAAIATGRFTESDAARFKADARAVEEVVAHEGVPFGARWQDWRPDPNWPLPTLPDGIHLDYRA